MATLRRLESAEILSIGSELTTGETRDTNGGDISRSLTELGVEVRSVHALPDDLAAVSSAFRDGLARVDLVVSTGGLGPTPDDLTREAIAAAVGETPTVDRELETWLRELWSRRGMPMPDLNLKQAWLIRSATALMNSNGTAPGWWVDRPDGGVVVALPGPPREMGPIWADDVLPRLRSRGARDVASRTFRLAGIGESLVAELLGDELLRSRNPVVATYARSDAVDVRVSAHAMATDSGAGSSAEHIVGKAAARVREVLGEYVWAEGATSWGDAIGTELDDLGWSLAVLEVGTGGSLGSLLGDRRWLRIAESLTPDAPAAVHHAGQLLELAQNAREVGGADVAVGVAARPHGDDTAVSVLVVGPAGVHRERRIAFLGGSLGRSRAGLTAAAVLLAQLRRAKEASGERLA